MKPIDRGGNRGDREELDLEQDHQNGGPYQTAAARVGALVIVPILPRRDYLRAKRDIQGEGTDGAVSPGRSPEARLEEAIGLAQAIDLDVRHAGVVRVATIRPATLFGSGKVKELEGLIATEDVELVVIDQALTPVQQRNLETPGTSRSLTAPG